MKKIFIFCSLCFLTVPILGQTEDDRAATPVSFTLADRDRLIKLEVEVAALNNKIDTEISAVRRKIDSLHREIDSPSQNMNARINSLERLMYIMITGIFGLIGFTVWDRRTFNLKLEKRVEVLEKRPLVYSPE